MKYFDEEKMADIREAFDSEVLKWKDVVSRPMMGCLCYLRKRKFVFFLVTDGIVIMKLSDKDQTVLKEKFGGKPFEMAGQTSRLWVTPLKSTKDLKLVMPFVRKRYEEAVVRPRGLSCETRVSTHVKMSRAISKSRSF